MDGDGHQLVFRTDFDHKNDNSDYDRIWQLDEYES